MQNFLELEFIGQIILANLFIYCLWHICVRMFNVVYTWYCDMIEIKNKLIRVVDTLDRILIIIETFESQLNNITSSSNSTNNSLFAVKWSNIMIMFQNVVTHHVFRKLLRIISNHHSDYFQKYDINNVFNKFGVPNLVRLISPVISYYVNNCVNDKSINNNGIDITDYVDKRDDDKSINNGIDITNYVNKCATNKAVNKTDPFDMMDNFTQRRFGNKFQLKPELESTFQMKNNNVEDQKTKKKDALIAFLKNFEIPEKSKVCHLNYKTLSENIKKHNETQTENNTVDDDAVLFLKEMISSEKNDVEDYQASNTDTLNAFSKMMKEMNSSEKNDDDDDNVTDHESDSNTSDDKSVTN